MHLKMILLHVLSIEAMLFNERFSSKQQPPLETVKA